MKQTDTPVRHPMPPPDSITENTVTAGGQKVDYQAIAGALTVGATMPLMRCSVSTASCCRMLW
jgi:hypothetical protein